MTINMRSGLSVRGRLPRADDPKTGRPEQIGVGLFHRSGPPSSSSSDSAWNGIVVPGNYVHGFVAETTWAALQPSAAGETFPVSNAIVDAIDTATEMNLQLKLRIFFGANAPGWAKNIGGAPLTLQEPQGGGTFTIGRFWHPSYIAAYKAFWVQFASTFNEFAWPNGPIVDVALSGPHTRYVEPMIRQTAGEGGIANRTVYKNAGYTLGDDLDAHAEAIKAHLPVNFSSSYACNPFQKGTGGTDVIITQALMDYLRGVLGMWGTPGNNSLRSDGALPKYEILYAKLETLGANGPPATAGPTYIQTAAPSRVVSLFETCQQAVAMGVTYIELPGTTEQYTDTDVTQGMSPAQFATITEGLTQNAAAIGYAMPPVGVPDPDPQTVITNVNPTSGIEGTEVIITGDNFTGTTDVTFDGDSATFAVDDDEHITTEVPTGATDGPIAVVAPFGTAVTSFDFDVTEPTPSAPTISSFTPTSGPATTEVTITGNDFTGATAVRFNGVAAVSFSVDDDEHITAAVPAGATTGPISVTTPAGTGSSLTSFTVTAAAPTVTGFTPTTGAVGTSVVITGTNFTAVSSVRFNGVAATFLVNSLTQITATVPVGSSTGKVSVVTGAGTGTSVANFTVPAPTISSFSPSSGAVNTVVTITGTGFLGATTVRFNGISTPFTINSATQIVTSVPAGAFAGPITVTTPAGTGTSSGSFAQSTWRVPDGVWAIRETSTATMGSNETNGANIALPTPGVTGYGRRFRANNLLPANSGGALSAVVLDTGRTKAQQFGKLYRPRFMCGQWMPAWAMGPTFTDQNGTGPVQFMSDGSPNTVFENAYRQMVQFIADWAADKPDVRAIDCSWWALAYSELYFGPGVQQAYGGSVTTNRTRSIAAHKRLMDIAWGICSPLKIPVAFGLSGHGPITDHADQLAAYAVTLAGSNGPGVLVNANGWAPGGEWGNTLEPSLDAAVWPKAVRTGLQDIHPANGGPRTAANWDTMFGYAENPPVETSWVEIYTDQWGLQWNANQAAYDNMRAHIAGYVPKAY